mgnify:CR=1 FL=1
MKKHIYPRLAVNGITKNKRLYLPYLLSCACMVTVSYIVSALAKSEVISALRGGDAVCMTLSFGIFVMAVFSAIFLFYTNSFIIRRRKKEFGLYNILGMGKKNIAVILFWENLFAFLLTVATGLIFGIAFSKLAELSLVKIMNGAATYTFTVSLESLKYTVITFAVIFLLIFLNGLRQIRFSGAAELIKSENVGEKAPKANFLVALLGVLLLGAAYRLAVTIKDPVAAMALFFIAVIMVIIATYLIFISASVSLCRILQKNKRYYYKPNHFISVSSMAFRMKKNGAGLASVCILATMVLVTLSSTASLYMGLEDSLAAMHTRDASITVRLEKSDFEKAEGLKEGLSSVLEKNNISVKNRAAYMKASFAGYYTDGVLQTDIGYVPASMAANTDKLITLAFIPLSDYNEIMGTNETLSSGEAIAAVFGKTSVGEEITVSCGKTTETLKIKKVADFSARSDESAVAYPSVYVAVSDISEAVAPFENMQTSLGEDFLTYTYYYGFDSDMPEDDLASLFKTVSYDISDFLSSEDMGITNFTVSNIASDRKDFMGTYGGLLFLGIVLSLAFSFAAVMIIYYKQISEGYDDRHRFEIMQKVGLQQSEIKKSINSQLLTVFFAPLVFAGLHLAFAFPMVKKILIMFNLSNISVFAVTTLVCFAVFFVLYAIVYKLTSNSYYSIVRTR